MCVIIVKPKGVALPSSTTISKAFAANNDGFGLAYSDGNSVRIRKGAMSLKKVRRLLSNVLDPVSKDMILHFRVATHGSVCPENCHPYPVTENKGLMRATTLTTNMAIAHNGIITGYGTRVWVQPNVWTPSGEKKRAWTDTQRYIKKVLSPLNESILNHIVQGFIADDSDSKFALLTPKGTHLIGTFLEGTDGCFYSNFLFNFKVAPVTALATQRTRLDNDNYYCDLCGRWTYRQHLHDGNWICYDCLVCLDDTGKGQSYLDTP